MGGLWPRGKGGGGNEKEFGEREFEGVKEGGLEEEWGFGSNVQQQRGNLF